MQVRTFLFLQGPPSLFWRDLSLEIERLGHRTRRINLNFGDFLYWPRRGATSYRGRLRNWRAYLTEYIRREGVTDILYYADRLPYHVIACEVAREIGVRATAVEFGYLRPDWITIERDGMSAYSHFPNDPQVIRELAVGLEPPDMTAVYPFPHAVEGALEVVYNMFAFYDRIVFPFRECDRIYSPLPEYVSHLPRIFLTKRNQRRSRQTLEALLSSGTPFYLFPLQIDADYQLRANAPFYRQADAVKLAIHSFARHAPKDAALVFKQHPLDNAMTRWKSRIRRLARRYGVADRVRFVRAGDLNVQLSHALGAVVINSTVGLHALRVGCPVKALGVAVYDIPGLTFQGHLDDFWTKADKPDEALFDALRAVMANTIQVRGNFYSREGRRAGAMAAAQRLVEGRVNEPGAYVAIPPRLARARRMGLQPADSLGRQIRQSGLIELDDDERS